MIFVAATLLLATVANGALDPRRSEDYYPDYAVYHDVKAYEAEVLRLSRDWPQLITLEQGKSAQGRVLYLMRLTDILQPRASNGKQKVRILMSFGEHAREFLPVESFFGIVANLTTGYHRGEPMARFLLHNCEFLLVGLLNPDGRQRVEETKDYCWRKTGTGVDLNRNFDWEFGGPESSADVGSEVYRGAVVFSEPESRFLRDIAINNKPHGFMSLHTGARDIFIPFADTKSKSIRRKHSNYDKELQLGKDMQLSTGKWFLTVGSVVEANDYTADGTICDYMAGALNIPFSFVLELWGHRKDIDNCFAQFNPHSSILQEELATFFPIYHVFFLRILSDYHPDIVYDAEKWRSPPLLLAHHAPELDADIEKIHKVLSKAADRLKGWQKGVGFSSSAKRWLL